MLNCFSVIIAFLAVCLTTTFARAQALIHPGDHIAIVGNTFADQLRIHGYLETLLLQHTQQAPVSIRNLGWGGDMLDARDRPTGFPPESSTLTAHKTDLIIACFGMGESFEGEEGIAKFKTQLQAFIDSHAGKNYNGKSPVRLILVSPIACEDHGKRTPSRDKRNRELHAYTEAMREVAASAKLPFVDLFERSRYWMDEARGPNLTDNGIHLNAFGYWAISHLLYDQLTITDRSPKIRPWNLSIDAVTKSTRAVGVQLTGLVIQHNGLKFQVEETSLPKLRPPTDQALQLHLEMVRDELRVANLQPGKYQLTIDETPVVTASADEWELGVAVDSTPLHKTIEAYRDSVNDKNLQFTYSWKALNQVHIVGERKKSPSGRSLPQEVIEFEKLAKEREKQLAKPIQLKTREWRITRVEF